MLTREETAGTTLEVLAPFLPYGIEVEVCRSKRGKLVALPMGQISQRIMPDVLVPANGSEPDMYSLSDVVPVLKPFSTLCEPLEDGTVPAVEVAKLCLGAEVDLEDPSAFLWTADEDDSEDQPWIEVTGQDAFTGDGLSFSIYPDWTWYGNGLNDNCAPAACLRYLFSKHFAVGLTESQYIPKSPATLPIQKQAS